MPLVQNLNKSIRSSIDNPKIIPSKITYQYESFMNTPKIVLIIENKTINTKILNTTDEKIIDYNDLDMLSSKNIFNYINNQHALMIMEDDKYYKTINKNFAYHYFIDKMGNIYEGRPHNLKAYNLDIFKYDQTTEDVYRLEPSNLLFNDCLIILTEENTNDIDTTNATYTALKSLLTYLRQYYEYNKFYTYSELYQIPFKNVKTEKEDLTRFNNPGIFFKVNELHSSTERTKLVKDKTESGNKIYTYGERVLRYLNPNNMNGNDVIILQKMLYKIGLFDKYEFITGNYDLRTKITVENFQKKYYITPDTEYGVADINTLNMLRTQIYKKKMSNVNIIDDVYRLNRILEYREDNMMSGYDVELLQKKLSQISMPLAITGSFDLNTKDAVRFFQIQNEILYRSDIVDGKVGPKTWDLIFNSTDKLYVDDNDEKVPGSITEDSIINKKYINNIQKAINKILEIYGIEIKITGYYDEATRHYIGLINKNEYNRKVIGLDQYDEIVDWTDNKDLETCYPIEYVYLVKHYLLNEKIDITLEN